MKSARINFGQPNTEYKLEINEAGEATSCYNQDTNTEYIGGGGGDEDFVIIHYSPDDGNLDITWNELNTIIESGKYPVAVSFSQPGGSIIATALFIENAYIDGDYYYGDGTFFSSNGNHFEVSAVATSPNELLNIPSD